jgi:acyl transferase domain-containing protein/surfactin synthase thioesterase subunit
MTTTQSPNDDSIAVVGMAGRFPGARDVAALWSNLCAGVESVHELSLEELEQEGVSPDLLRDPSYVRARPYLDDIELFDAAFFSYSPREAETMDPQHRFFLETAYEALEDAGYDPGAAAGRVGVFGAADMSTYLLSNLGVGEISRLADDLDVLIGNDKDYLTTRVSYKLDLRGPSVNVNSACSSSLVAVCLACDSLLGFQSDMALAGGVAITVPQRTGYLYRDVAGGLSPDGHCRAFDAASAGTIFGSGVGIVVLKRLADALANGDHVRAVIRGYAVNNDGSAKVGYMAPGVDGHAQVIREALRMADVPAESIGYFEAHGTGTALGDPIEIAAITKAFEGVPPGHCALGSLKTNIGHLTSAAGVAGLIKTVLMLEHGMLVPSLHFETPSPRIDIARAPVHVNTRLRDWPTGGGRRRAGVSALGVGGTNAHVVLEEAGLPARDAARRSQQLLVLSARTPAALESAKERLALALAGLPTEALADVAFTLQVGRAPFRYRAAVVASTPAEAAELLAGQDRRRLLTGDALRPATVAMLFAGIGSFGNARGVVSGEPALAREIAACLEAVPAHSRGEIADAISRDDAITSGRVGLPALLVFQCALVRFWSRLGVQPVAVCGHSAGEYAAAVTAGILSLEQAVALAAFRGSLLDRLQGGAMLTVALPPEELEPLLGPDISLAAANAPSLCMVSGGKAAVERLERTLRARGVVTLRSPIPVASHSHLVDPVLPELARFAEQVELRPAAVPLASSVTGELVRPGEAIPWTHWVDHLRRPVVFSSALAHVVAARPDVLVEIGPDQTLTPAVRRNPGVDADAIVSSAPAAGTNAAAGARHLLETVGRLWTRGLAVDWTALHEGEQRRRVPLPTYPFERRRHWADALPDRRAPERRRVVRRKRELRDWFYLPTWRQSLPPPSGSPRARLWVILDDGSPLVAELARDAEHRGGRTLRVAMGDSLALGRPLATIDPQQQAHYDALVARVSAEDAVPTFVHCWSLADAGADPEDLLTAGIRSVIHLWRALAGQPEGRPVRLCIVTREALQVSGEEVPRALGATVCAATKVLPRERTDARCRCIDIRSAAGEAGSASTARRLVDEIALEGGEPLVALRGSKRWVPHAEQIALERRPECSRIKQGGVYLITGGLGRVGRLVATMLASEHDARLVLLGRSAGQDGDELVVDPAKVLVRAGDVADVERLAAVVDEAETTFGRIDGVFHLAADVRPETFELARDATDEHLDDVFRAKVAGTLALDEVLRDRSPDFVLLASSLVAVVGGLGNLSYAAANAFLDAYAAGRSSHRTRWVAVNWDAWRLPGTLGAYTGRGTTLELVLGDLPMAPDEAIDALRRILEGPSVPQVIVSTGDLDARIAQLDDTRASGRRGEREPTTRASQQPFEEPETDLERTLASLWEDALRVDRVGRSDNFFELGGDSLVAVQLVGRLREVLGMEVDLRAFVESPTIAALAAAIAESRTPIAVSRRSPLVPLRVGGAEAISLLCLPYAGGSAIVYKQVSDLLPASIAVYALEPDGLGDVTGDELVERYLREVAGIARGPVAVYGHCGASVLAVDLAHRLERAGADLRAAFVGAALPLADEQLTTLIASGDARDIENETLGMLLRGLGAFDGGLEPSDLEPIVDRFRRQAIGQWQHYEWIRSETSLPRLDAPLVAFVAADDPLTAEYATRWQEWGEFGQDVSLEVLPEGGHYFIRTQPVAVAALIGARLAVAEAVRPE